MRTICSTKRQSPVHKEALFELPVKITGRYEVRIAYSPQPNRATNVPVKVTSADDERTVRINQRKPPVIDKVWQPVGTFRFAAGKPALVVISNDGCDGYVIVDAVQLVAVEGGQ